MTTEIVEFQRVCFSKGKCFVGCFDGKASQSPNVNIEKAQNRFIVDLRPLETHDSHPMAFTPCTIPGTSTVFLQKRETR